MPKLRLTSLAVERFPAPITGQVEYFDTHLPSFGIRVSYSGAKAWFIMTRVERRLTRITLGRFPALSLADARDKARAVMSVARSGRDPRLIEAEQRRRRTQERETLFGSWRCLPPVVPAPDNIFYCSRTRRFA